MSVGSPLAASGSNAFSALNGSTSSGGGHYNEDIDEASLELLPEDYGEEEPVQLNDDTSTIVVVDNIPVIKMNRYEALVGVIRKVFAVYGELVEDGIYIPTQPVAGSEEQQTCGYAFVEYTTLEGAQRAIHEGNGKRLDAKHTLAVNALSDIDKYNAVPDEYTEPDRNAFEHRVQLGSWLQDENGRDQFVLRYGTETEIYWFDPLRKANEMAREYKYGGERERHGDSARRWTDLYTSWSPRGTYLSTFHAQGIALWGGDQFEKLSRFSHNNVAYLDFSPSEKYMVTSNQLFTPGQAPTKQQTQNEEALIVWEIRGSKKIRAFPAEQIQPTGATLPNAATQWPILRWSHDDKYCARITKDAIAVYELPGMTLLDKKSIKIPSVADCVWSPVNNLLAYWVPESTNKPAHAGLIEIPSRQLKREKHLYNVVDLKLYWQELGDYLCVKVIRRKTKTKMHTNLEIFRLREGGGKSLGDVVPVDVIELDEPVSAFAWERCSAAGAEPAHRFAIIHSANAEVIRPNVSIYSVKKGVKKLTTFEALPANGLFWSPLGSFLVAAGLGTLNGQLTFIDADTQEVVNANEHFMANEVDWDPSGRYVLSTVSQPIGETNWRYTMENGYRMWSPHGALLTTVSLDKCYQVLWRPRPQTLLTQQQIQTIKKELRERYYKRFEAEDQEVQNAQLSGVARERLELQAEWKRFRSEQLSFYRAFAEERQNLRHGVPSDDDEDYEEVDQSVEEVIDTQYEVLP